MNRQPRNQANKRPPAKTGGKKPPAAKKPARKRTAIGLKGVTQSSLNQALRTQKRSSQLADQVIDKAQIADKQPAPKTKVANIFGQDQLKVVFLGGQDAIGAKNMVVLEYDKDALILDCGNDLGLDLPGVNYAICDTTYLEEIKGKLKGYVISHGHLDHIGGLPHILPKYPAPVYGSPFTIGMIKKALANSAESAHLVDQLKFYEMNMDGHERLLAGKSFYVELVRITHSIPQSSCIIVDTPAGRVVNTGDFRLDPEPLDFLPSDIKRLRQLGDEGVLLLLSESTNAQTPDRTPTEHTLQPSFNDLIKRATGRMFVATISSNINRIQMIINSAAEGGRKVAIDGRSMIQHVELAIRMGLLKVPKDTIVTLAQLASLPDDRILMLCTGWQGEIGASLQRMSIGEHKYINLRPGDTVVVSSKPIPGNIPAYDKLGDDLVKLGCRLYRAPTWEVDGSAGPLHVSGHGCRGEQREMLEIIRPRYFAPIYAGAMNRHYHAQLAEEEVGLDGKNIFMANNGDMLTFNTAGAAKLHQNAVTHGSVLIDDSGQAIPSMVIKDRLLLNANGLVVIILTINRQSGQLISSPDIVTRGFIYIRDNEELMSMFRNELKRAVNQRFNRIALDRFKTELKDHATHFLYNQTQRSPIVIPVINIVSDNGNGRPRNGRKATEGGSKSPTAKNYKRLVELRTSIRDGQLKNSP
ncbi:ribonuclease J [Candidatus Saccharibacteria bacterium]|nr:ribonuclease J [Candidatus Saccharibacteria bacterium]